MSSIYSLSPTNPHKRPRHSHSPSRRHVFCPSYPPHQPSLSDLAHDRLASRNKLQSTWEDIIQKYSSLADDEADEIDLETGQVVVDHGHLKSLHDSALWDPLDSEADDDETPPSERVPEEEDDDQLVHYYPPRHERTPAPDEQPPAPEDEQQQETKLPSEQEIIKQFGEQYGRDILAYLQERNSSTKNTTTTKEGGKSLLWHGLKDEESIFARAKELWKQYRMRRPSPVKHARFDKDTFERAVFGSTAAGFSKSAFEEAVFGHVLREGWGGEEDKLEERQTKGSFHEVVFGQGSLDDDVVKEESAGGGFLGEQSFEKGVFEKRTFDEIVFGQRHVAEAPDEDEERGLDLGGPLTTSTIDDEEIQPTPQKDYKAQRIESPVTKREVILLDTPIRTSTPPTKGPLSSTKKQSTARKKGRGRTNIVTGLVVNASDEEDDFFSSITSPSPSIKLKRNATRSVSSTPIVLIARERSPSTSSSVKGRTAAQTSEKDAGEEVQIAGLGTREEPFTTDGDTSELTTKKNIDTKASCGDIGYRCTKPFCFKCI